MKKLTPEVLRWIAAGFFAVSALVFLPSLASGLMLAAAILTAPLPGLDEMIREKFHLKKTARIAIVTIVFFAAAMMTPGAETSRANAPAAPAQSVTSQAQLPIQQTTSDKEDKAAAEDPQPADAEDVPQVEDEPEANTPDTDPAPVQPPQEAAVEPAAPVYTPPATNEQSYTVYITNTGSKYHRAGCRHLKDSQIAIDINDAIAQGYTACKDCGG